MSASITPGYFFANRAAPSFPRPLNQSASRQCSRNTVPLKRLSQRLARPSKVRNCAPFHNWFSFMNQLLQRLIIWKQSTFQCLLNTTSASKELQSTSRTHSPNGQPQGTLSNSRRGISMLNRSGRRITIAKEWQGIPYMCQSQDPRQVCRINFSNLSQSLDHCKMSSLLYLLGFSSQYSCPIVTHSSTSNQISTRRRSCTVTPFLGTDSAL